MLLTELPDDLIFHLKKFLNCVDRSNMGCTCKELYRETYTSHKVKCKFITFKHIQGCATHNFPNNMVLDSLKVVTECPFIRGNEYKLNFPSVDSMLFAKYIVTLEDFAPLVIDDQNRSMMRYSHLKLYIKENGLIEDKRQFMNILQGHSVLNDRDFYRNKRIYPIHIHSKAEQTRLNIIKKEQTRLNIIKREELYRILNRRPYYHGGYSPILTPVAIQHALQYSTVITVNLPAKDPPLTIKFNPDSNYLSLNQYLTPSLNFPTHIKKQPTIKEELPLLLTFSPTYN